MIWRFGLHCSETMNFPIFRIFLSMCAVYLLVVIFRFLHHQLNEMHNENIQIIHTQHCKYTMTTMRSKDMNGALHWTNKTMEIFPRGWQQRQRRRRLWLYVLHGVYGYLIHIYISKLGCCCVKVDARLINSPNVKVDGVEKLTVWWRAGERSRSARHSSNKPTHSFVKRI